MKESVETVLSRNSCLSVTHEIGGHGSEAGQLVNMVWVRYGWNGAPGPHRHTKLWMNFHRGALSNDPSIKSLKTLGTATLLSLLP